MENNNKYSLDYYQRLAALQEVQKIFSPPPKCFNCYRDWCNCWGNNYY